MVRHCLMNRVSDSEHYHLRQILLAEASRQDHRREKSAALRPILVLGRRVNDTLRGAGESVANWWLSHPEEPREDVAKLLVRLVRGALPELDSPPRSEARS